MTDKSCGLGVCDVTFVFRDVRPKRRITQFRTLSKYFSTFGVWYMFFIFSGSPVHMQTERLHPVGVR